MNEMNKHNNVLIIQEWNEELRFLLSDLTSADGKIKSYVPDPDTEAGVAYLKVKAVYGRIDKFENLARISTVTHWLDRTKTIRSMNVNVDWYFFSKLPIFKKTLNFYIFPIWVKDKNVWKLKVFVKITSFLEKYKLLNFLFVSVCDSANKHQNL